MRNETPAAFPLIALITGLALGPVLVNPRFTAVAVVVLAFLVRRTAVLFAALGILLALHKPAAPPIDTGTFTLIEAPLHHDWQARNDGAFVLRTHEFRANGERIESPISIYTRFEPPEIGLEQTIRAEGFLRRNERGDYSVSVKSPVLLSYHGRVSPFWPATWNRLLARRLERAAGQHPDEVALAQALLLGRGERLSLQIRDSFRSGGTYHLLVFSGLQIALAAALLGALLRWLHAPRASDWLLLTFAMIAPLFIGATASVSRASLGIGLYALARILKRPTSMENLWCVAALLRLIIEPRDLTDPSFHLTYAGAGALLFLGRRWITKPLTIEIAIAPLTLFHFHQYALGGSLLTIVMSPLMFAMLVLSAVACAIPHGIVFAAIGALHRVCALLNAFGFSGAFAAPPAAALIAGAFGALLALALLRERTRALAIACAMLLPIAAAIVRSATQREVEHPTITVFDVGQADAIAVRSRDKTVLVDAGADGRIVPLLADSGIRRIDAAVLTHAHPDHCGGLVPILQQLDVSEVWVTPHRFRGDCATRLLAMRPRIHLVRDGSVRTIGDMTLTAHLAGTFRKAPENNASVVLRVETGGRKILLTGDIETEAEIVLSERDLRADILKVAHHGSRTSTTPRFLDAVAPRLALISCGRRNLFGHPHPRVLEALRERRIRTWRTDTSGTIDVEIRDGRLYAAPRKD